MYTEDLIIDHHAQGQEIKHVGKIMPNIGIAVFSGAFGVKAIGLRHTSRLMVSADQVDSLRVSQFQTNKQRDRFDAE